MKEIWEVSDDPSRDQRLACDVPCGGGDDREWVVVEILDSKYLDSQVVLRVALDGGEKSFHLSIDRSLGFNRRVFCGVTTFINETLNPVELEGKVKV